MVETESLRSSGDLVVGVDIGGTKTALLAWDLTTSAVLARTFQLPPRSDQKPWSIVWWRPSTLSFRNAGGASGSARARGCRSRSGRRRGRDRPDCWKSEWLVPGAAVDLLAVRLKIPVAIEHDANAAALGERWRGAARELESFAFVALGTGIGVGIIVDGQLYRGAHHAAGELGDLVVGREYLGQERGGQGNLAQLIGGKSLRRRAKQATGDDLSAAEVISEAESDPELAAMADEVDDYLAMAIIAIAALLDPEAIIVGGGTAEAGEDLLDPVRERVAREVPALPLIIASALGSEAQLYGAVFAALQNVGTPG